MFSNVVSYESKCRSYAYSVTVTAAVCDRHRPAVCEGGAGHGADPRQHPVGPGEQGHDTRVVRGRSGLVERRDGRNSRRLFGCVSDQRRSNTRTGRDSGPKSSKTINIQHFDPTCGGRGSSD
ncbi:hypothetical protein F2P81_006784 [Scophthalmus maximus]|uniref:Uncharacterized protein n=1 Tax=Scophthalmus maximus TaxID=52904 RepID=A0A6A4T070_SCOMX|nr:hypothetical protein F2P81_006784 [Scophthalmus maximus]